MSEDEENVNEERKSKHKKKKISLRKKCASHGIERYAEEDNRERCKQKKNEIQRQYQYRKKKNEGKIVKKTSEGKCIDIFGKKDEKVNE